MIDQNELQELHEKITAWGIKWCNEMIDGNIDIINAMNDPTCVVLVEEIADHGYDAIDQLMGMAMQDTNSFKTILDHELLK
jgi:hypothetical protein